MGAAGDIRANENFAEEDENDEYFYFDVAFIARQHGAGVRRQRPTEGLSQNAALDGSGEPGRRGEAEEPVRRRGGGGAGGAGRAGDAGGLALARGGGGADGAEGAGGAVPGGRGLGPRAPRRRGRRRRPGLQPGERPPQPWPPFHRGEDGPRLSRQADRPYPPQPHPRPPRLPADSPGRGPFAEGEEGPLPSVTNGRSWSSSRWHHYLGPS